jgi:hypothetical protein
MQAYTARGARCYDEINSTEDGDAMDIDERLEKLADRHEALTQAVELLAAMYQQNEKRLTQVLDAINRLANIAEAHDVRLDDHERAPDDPPGAA